MLHTDLEEKQEEILRQAHALYAAPDMEWVRFYRAILGVDGLVHRMFPTNEGMTAFERTTAYVEIQQMVRKLRQRTHLSPPPEEEIKVLTIRIPQSLYDTIYQEAHQNHVSMNKLCISKLMQLIDESLVPSRKNRKPAASKRNRAIRTERIRPNEDQG